MWDIEKVKLLLSRMNKTNFISRRPLSAEQKALSIDVTDAAYSIFVEIKMQSPSYTIDGDRMLKKFVVDEESDNEPNYKIDSYFNNNSNALYEVVAYKFVAKRKNYRIENHLFHISIFSYICDKEYDVFFVNKKNELFYFDNSITSLKLVDYISKYFVKIPDNVHDKIDILAHDNTLSHEAFQEQINIIIGELNEKARGKTASFQKGAITFMDFLGWKGLWQNLYKENHLENVSQLIQRAEQKIQEMSNEFFPYSSDIELSKLISISDTIAIFTPEIEGINEFDLLELHAKIAKYVLEECVKRHYAIRGAITFGQYNTKNNIMIGPGIDECASWHETCDWIGVHFTPSAELVVRKKDSDSDIIIFDPNIPIKKGYPKAKYCVRWQVSKEVFAELTDNVPALLPEISAKYMNTYEFLYERRENDGKNGIDKK